MYQRVVRMPSPADVAHIVAEHLIDFVSNKNATQDRVDVCLAGGTAANAMYEQLSDLAVGSDIDFTKLHLWWGDERFVPATDPERNSLQAIERLARTIRIHSANIHMMAARDGHKDARESADVYETELENIHFDVVLLGIGPDGHTASIFPNHPSFEKTNRLVIGVEDAPKPPSERITLTFNALNRTESLWFIATGEQKANAVAKALAGDMSLPAAHAHGERSTLWFLDDAAASALPPAFRCEFSV